MNEELKTSDKVMSTFDIDSMPLTTNLISAIQEGNFLVGVTDTGVRFRQRIPQGKMLSKNEKGEWIFIPLRVNLG